MHFPCDLRTMTCSCPKCSRFPRTLEKILLATRALAKETQSPKKSTAEGQQDGAGGSRGAGRNGPSRDGWAPKACILTGRGFQGTLKRGFLRRSADSVEESPGRDARLGILRAFCVPWGLFPAKNGRDDPSSSLEARFAPGFATRRWHSRFSAPTSRRTWRGRRAG